MKIKFDYKDIDKISTLDIIYNICIDAVKKGHRVDITIRSK